MLGCDLLCDREAKASPLARWFGGVEGVEHVVECIVRDPWPVVLDYDGHPAVRGQAANLDGATDGLAGGMHRVVQDVGDDLMQGAAVALDSLGAR